MRGAQMLTSCIRTDSRNITTSTDPLLIIIETPYTVQARREHAQIPAN